MFLLKKITVHGLALIFMLTLTLSPLGAKEDPENIPFYKETDIGKSAGVTHPGPIIRLNSKQQLVVYDVIVGKGKNINRFVTLSPDGKLLSEFKLDFTGEGQIFALDPKDNLYVVAQEHNQDQKTGRGREIRRKLHIYDPKGKKLQTLDLGKTVVKDDDINLLRDIAIDSKGNVYLAFSNEGLSMLGKNTKKPKNLRSGADYYSIVIDPADNLITHGFNRSTYAKFIEKMKPTNFTQVWKTNLETNEWISRIFYNTTDKSIYALGRKQIGKYDSSGNFGSIVFDFMDNGLIGEDIKINSLAVDPLANIYLSIYYRKDSKDCIKKYSPIPDSKRDKNQKTLTIGVSRSDGNFLEKACSMFQKTHPDWTVNIKEYSSTQGADGYRKTLNTELLAGKGPDIIAVGSLPYLEYCEKRNFVDLTEFITKESSSTKTPELDWSKFDLDTMKACEYEGKLYVLPVNLNLEILYANQTLLDRAGIKIDDLQWTWRDFLDIAVKVTKDTNNDGVIDQYALPKMNDSELFSSMFRSNQFLDYKKKTARFDSPEFREILSVCKSLIDKKVMNPQVDFQKLFFGQGRGSIAFTCMALNQYSDPVVWRELIFQDKITMLSLPGTGQEDIRFNTSMIFAINRRSPFKNEAWELVKIMCSDELQNSPEMMSFPINLTARKAKAEYAMTIENFRGKKVAQMLTKEELSKMNGLLGRIGGHRYSDPWLSGIIYAEVTKFFNGEKTADEVGKIIQNKVNTYLNE